MHPTRLLRRYEREFNRGQAPLLKRVLQHDEAPSCLMVLLVAQVHCPPPQQQPQHGKGAAVQVRGRSSVHGGCKGQLQAAMGGRIGGWMLRWVGHAWDFMLLFGCVRPRRIHLLHVVTVMDTLPLQLELTDGWYWIKGVCDEPLSQLARAGKIAPGAWAASSQHDVRHRSVHSSCWNWDLHRPSSCILTCFACFARIDCITH